jgi:hypothetical protein
MSPLNLWIGGYGPQDSAHGRGLSTFRDIVEAETAGDVSVRITWNIMEEGRPNTDLFDLVECSSATSPPAIWDIEFPS